MNKDLVFNANTFRLKILNLCKKEGLINQLKLSLKVPEAERFKYLKISNNGLSMLDAVHCVYDKERTTIFLNSIEKVIKKIKNPRVIEAGIGTGILSFFSSIQGAKVLGIELNPLTFKLAKKFNQILLSKNIIKLNSINLVKADAIEYKTKERFNILISENLYTGMLFEKQVQINNNLIKYLSDEAIVIPNQMKSHLILTNTKFPLIDKSERKLYIPEHEGKAEVLYEELSTHGEYSDIVFNKKIKKKVNSDITLKIRKNSEVNSFLIYSEIFLPNKEVVRRGQTSFLNNDIIIKLDKWFIVKVGEVWKVSISYTYGDTPEMIKTKFKKIK